MPERDYENAMDQAIARWSAKKEIPMSNTAESSPIPAVCPQCGREFEHRPWSATGHKPSGQIYTVEGLCSKTCVRAADKVHFDRERPDHEA